MRDPSLFRHLFGWLDEPQFDSFDPADPDGLQVAVFDHPPLSESDSKHLRDMIESGNRLWKATKPSGAAEGD